jgi:glycosyltransferase involved in cell wall biosynthesis
MKMLEKLAHDDYPDQMKAMAHNAIGTIRGVQENYNGAIESFRTSLTLDPKCLEARLNLDFLGTYFPIDAEPPGQAAGNARPDAPSKTSLPKASEPLVRLAILSFLFNWPSTGGGNIHTVELAKFLARAGYEIQHFYAKCPSAGLGRVEDSLPFESCAIEFDIERSSAREIQDLFRTAVKQFEPDYVLITDSWNFKPLLADAMRDYPTLLRFQAMECLCPLNNLRLLANGPDQIEQCPKHQLATPDYCHRCLMERGRHSGALHQLERALSAVGTPEYDAILRSSLEQAEAVLVFNPMIETIISPYARSVKVVPWGMDSSRFPWPPPDDGGELRRPGVTSIFQAAYMEEFIKGFHVLREACAQLWSARHDFELVVTGDAPASPEPFIRYVGWQSQDHLPRVYRSCDICVVPTIAQDGLSRTSVEAMASGLPVVASRIGGLPYTVSEGVTGLLCDPGNASDLARKLAVLLDDSTLRQSMGRAGRKRFEEDFTWEVVIERHYRPLLKPRAETAARR